MYNELQTIIGQAWENRELLAEASVQEAIREVIRLVDRGELRTAEPTDPEQSRWQVNEWVKKAVILYFPIQPMRRMEAGELEWYDKMDLKHGYEELGVRAVPHAVARYGAYIAPGAILMPSYVNIGAYVDTGTMVDTWATVGSCAQIGRHVHLSGGVGIGGVLEPVQAAPVIIEDNCFIGSRSIVVEGAHVCREAVLGSNTVITGSTHIIDVTGPEPVTYKGYVPPPVCEPPPHEKDTAPADCRDTAVRMPPDRLPLYPYGTYRGAERLGRTGRIRHERHAHRASRPRRLVPLQGALRRTDGSRPRA